MKTSKCLLCRAIDALFFMVLANSSCVYVWPAPQPPVAQKKLSDDFKLIQQIRDTDPASRGIYAIAIAPNEQFVAWRDRANRLTVYDFQQKKKLFRISPHDANWIQSIEFAPDSKSFVTVAGSGESVKVWETATGKLIRRIKSDAEVAWFSPDGSELALLGPKEVEVFFLTKPNRKSQANWRLKSELPLTMSRDGKLVISHRKLNQQIHQLELFNLNSKIRIDLPGDPTIPKMTRISSDSRWLAAAYEDLQRLHLWNVNDPKSLHYLLDGHRDPVTCFDFSGDSRFLATGSDSQIILWDLLTQQSIKTMNVAAFSQNLPRSAGLSIEKTGVDTNAASNRSPAKPMKIRSLAFSPLSYDLAVGSVGGDESVLSILDLNPVMFRANGPELSAEKVWIDLGSSSAEIGMAAVSRLKQNFASFEKDFRLKIKQQTFSNGSWDVDLLIDKLSSDNFREREFATEQLALRSNQLASTLKSKVIKELNSEARYRIRKVLTKKTTNYRISSEEYRRWSRLIFGLEMEDSSLSKTLLSRIQSGHSDSNISQLATESLLRLSSRNRNN